MFVMTKEWLHKYYGSKPDQVEQTREWLLKYGKNVTQEELEIWKDFKHLSEYQVNTPDIVPRCFDMIGREFNSELHAHALINELRVPVASRAYQEALAIADPSSILELGVGGDSAISTAIFLYYLEPKPLHALVSVDRNPLGMTWERYKDVPYWRFNMMDSLAALGILIQNNYRMDMVFIDTIHSYEHTSKELRLAQEITNFILMDDATFEGNDFDGMSGGVKRAIEEWREKNKDWGHVSYAGNSVMLLEKIR